MPTRYQDTEPGSNPDLLKDEAKDKFGRFKAGDHSLPPDYAVNFEWSVKLARRLLQGEAVDEYMPVGLVPVKRERPVFSRRLSAASASTTIDLCSPAKKPKTDDNNLEKEPGDLTADDVLLMLGGDVDRAIADEALAGFMHDLDVEEANIRELEANQQDSD